MELCPWDYVARQATQIWLFRMFIEALVRKLTEECKTEGREDSLPTSLLRLASLCSMRKLSKFIYLSMYLCIYLSIYWKPVGISNYVTLKIIIMWVRSENQAFMAVLLVFLYLLFYHKKAMQLKHLKYWKGKREGSLKILQKRKKFKLRVLNQDKYQTKNIAYQVEYGMMEDRTSLRVSIYWGLTLCLALSKYLAHINLFNIYNNLT